MNDVFMSWMRTLFDTNKGACSENRMYWKFSFNGIMTYSGMSGGSRVLPFRHDVV